MFCRQGYLPITYGIPPYGYFEHPQNMGPSRLTGRIAALFFLPRTLGPSPSFISKMRRGYSTGTQESQQEQTQDDQVF